MDIKQILATEFGLQLQYSNNIVDLISEGNTIPFIARYRKEMHGDCGDDKLRDFADRLQYLHNLVARKAEVKASIEGQDKWTDEIGVVLDGAKTLAEVEDIYRPYKQKKKTRASVAIEKGLEPLADIIMAQQLQETDIELLCEPFINEQVQNTQEAIVGAQDIIAERISDDAACRRQLRQVYSDGLIKSSLLEVTDKTKEKSLVYEGYKEFSQKIADIPSHRLLALNRGESEACLRIDIEADRDKCIQVLRDNHLKKSVFDKIIEDTISDSYDRLIAPSMERETRSELTDKANEQAIKLFEANLKPLLMQPPLRGRVILGLDPAYRTGCKIAVIDTSGALIDSTVIYPTPPTNDTKIAQAKEALTGLIAKHGVDVIAIGNGTASKESEIFVADLIKSLDRDVQYIVVNEAGASVYSASKLGSEEFPEHDVAIRSAASIARRLLDPLAELIKIDVKSIGVGQYQHDMPQKRLTEVLEGVVESCVNSVGVDLNTASYSLLSYVSGLNKSIAKNIVKHRETKLFENRQELLQVSKLGPKAYEQCAGFLRIANSNIVLDNTSVHPESYEAARQLLDILGYQSQQQTFVDIKERLNAKDTQDIAIKCGIGLPTLLDIVDELSKPGRDIRDSLPAPILRADLMDMNDLQPGMELVGTVRNVIDFGAFVDIGVHRDGLVHISEMADKFVKHPNEVLVVGQAVTVRVLEVDNVKQRISLSMRTLGVEKPMPRSQEQKRERQQRHRASDSRAGNGHNFRQNKKEQTSFHTSRNNPQLSMEEMLQRLQNKYSK